MASGASDVVGGVGWSGGAAAVGARGGDADSRIAGEGGEPVEDRAHERMRGHTQGDGVLAAGDEVAGARGPREHEGERAGPRLRGEGVRVGGHVRRPRGHLGGVAQVDDQRVVGGAALGRVDPGDGARQVRAGPEAVDRLRRHRREVAGGQGPGGLVRVGRDAHDPIQPGRLSEDW